MLIRHARAVRIRAIAIPCLLVTASFGLASASEDPGGYIAGYAGDIRGDILEYHSADPDVTSSLLVRSLQTERFIAWESAPVPESPAGAFVHFVWLFGMDASRRERHHFELFADGERWFRFPNPELAVMQEWQYSGRAGATLTFRGTHIDRHRDIFGYALLRLPRSAVSPGKPVRFRVVGESAGSRIWYMTFRAPVAPRVQLDAQPAVVREKGELRRVMSLRIDHLRAESSARITLPDGRSRSTSLRFGANAIPFTVREEATEREIRVQVEIGEARYEESVALRPLREWWIYLVQHTHTDVGYSRPQSVILPEHVRFLDYALALCDRTDDYPDDARFRWTCEAAWAVREFLRTRPPETIQRFRKRVREGRIEVTGMFLNMSEITDESTYADFLAPLRLFRQQGIPVVTAMQNDVNGAPWCLVDQFREVGIRYVSMGQHGHRALIPFSMPTCFWWESPAGEKVLAFRADHYHTGNFWGLHTGRFTNVEGAIFRYLGALEEKDYPFSRVAVQYSGYHTDNSPPAMVASNLVRRWNETYVWPRLRLATAREFLEYVETNHADSLPRYRVAWPDWWTDGTGSAARETAAARMTQTELAAIRSLLAMIRLLGSEIPESLVTEAARVSDLLLFYGEHTFGAAESIREPLSENSVTQWVSKASYAWEAVKSTQLLEEAAMGLLASRLPRTDVPSIVIVNSLHWPRSGYHEVSIDHELVPPGRRVRFVDSQGRVAPAFPGESRADGTKWGLWLDQVPAFGYRIYRIEVLDEDASFDTGPPGDAPPVLENAFYRIEIDPETGAITQWYDKELEQEFVDHGGEWELGQVIHETLGNRSQLEHFKLESVQRSSLTNVAVRRLAGHEMWQRVEVTGESPTARGSAGVRYEVRLYERAKLVELRYAIQKKQIFSPEGIYVAFPFALAGGKIVYEAQGGTATPGENLLPGTASDWQTMQSFSAVRGPESQIVVASREVPLMQFGGINLGRFEEVARIERPHMFSWVMNNYWTTNFRASQQGEFRFGYHLTSSRDTSNTFATRFGLGNRVPFLSRVLPAGEHAIPTGDRSLIWTDPPSVLLVGARPARTGQGVILHLRELEGQPARFIFDVKGEEIMQSIESVNVLEDRTGSHPQLTFTPHQVRFLRVAPDHAGEGDSRR